jgi:hypothetical protein
MTAHALPALEQWREALSTALGCYHSGNIGQKRKRDSTPPIFTGDDEKKNQLQKERMTQKLQDVCALYQEVQDIIKTRCSRFLTR